MKAEDLEAIENGNLICLNNESSIKGTTGDPYMNYISLVFMNCWEDTSAECCATDEEAQSFWEGVTAVPFERQFYINDISQYIDLQNQDEPLQPTVNSVNLDPWDELYTAMPYKIVYKLE